MSLFQRLHCTPLRCSTISLASMNACMTCCSISLFRMETANSEQPRKRSMVTRPFPHERAGSGHKVSFFIAYSNRWKFERRTWHASISSSLIPWYYWHCANHPYSTVCRHTLVTILILSLSLQADIDMSTFTLSLCFHNFFLWLVWSIVTCVLR